MVPAASRLLRNSEPRMDAPAPNFVPAASLERLKAEDRLVGRGRHRPDGVQGGTTMRAIRVTILILLAAAVLAPLPSGAAEGLADRILKLTRATKWSEVAAIRIGFKTFHPQGMVKIGENF